MAMESNIYALWTSKQTAKGSPNTAGTKRCIMVAGDLEVQRADGAEAWSDLDRFGNQTDFANTMMGAGSPGIEAQSDVLAYLCWQFFGGETFTSGTSPIQTITKGTASSGNFDVIFGVGGAASSTAATTPAGLNVASCTSAQMATALNLVPAIIAAGGVTCGGGPINTTPITVTFTNVSPLGLTAGSCASNATTPLVGGTAPTVAITTPGVMPKHVFTPQVGGGFWSTFAERIGNTTILRQQFSDMRLNSMSIEGSTANKVLRVTPNLVGLVPGTTYSSDPTSLINLANIPFLYTEGVGAFTIDGAVFQGQTQFNVTWEEGLAPAYGDKVSPFDFVPSLARITVAATIVVDAQGLGEYNSIIYGTASPSPGTQPIQALPAMGSYQCTMTKATGEKVTITIPAVHWSPGLSIGANPQGGIIDLSLAGEMRKQQGVAASTVTILNPDNAAYTT